MQWGWPLPCLRCPGPYQLRPPAWVLTGNLPPLLLALPPLPALALLPALPPLLLLPALPWVVAQAQAWLSLSLLGWWLHRAWLLPAQASQHRLQQALAALVPAWLAGMEWPGLPVQVLLLALVLRWAWLAGQEWLLE